MKKDEYVQNLTIADSQIQKQWRRVGTPGVLPSRTRDEPGLPKTTPSDQDDLYSRPVVRRPVTIAPSRRPRPTFIATSRWEGAVVEKMASYFVTEVIDLQNGEHSTVEFDLSDVADHDRDLCEPGALFYWSVGYEVKSSGTRSRSSVIAFRRTGTTIDF